MTSKIELTMPDELKLLIQRIIDGDVLAPGELAKLIEMPLERNIMDYFPVEEVTKEQIIERNLRCLI